MNQEQNNMNQNNFNTQGNNEIPNKQLFTSMNHGINHTFNQKMQQNININQQQPMQNQNTTNMYSQPQEPVQPQSTEVVVNQVPVSNINNSIQNNNNNSKKINKKNLLIILGIVTIIIIGVSLFFIFNKKDNNKINEEQNSNIPEEQIIESTLKKLKTDYESGKIDVNKYFTELVNYDYDYDSLDKEYKTDEIIYTTGNISEIAELLEKHRYELSEESIRKLFEKATLQDVQVGNEVSVEPQANTNNNVRVVPLNDTNNKNKIASHKLDKAYLSKNERFIIWYTNYGNDAITLEQVQDIANELENSISDYEKMFNTEYLYKPYYDELINKNYFNARETLKANGINAAKIDTAMNVYIYDTGSNGTLATYYNPIDTGILIETIILLGIDDIFTGESGIVSYPYIVMDKGTIQQSTENIKTVANHELFHHFQYLYCEGTEQHRCPNGYYTEATANLASVLVSEVSSTNNFLNGWAGRYTQELSGKLSDLADGYGQFPYYYTYTKVVNDWASVLTPALNEGNPTDYIKNNTSIEDLIKISEKVAYNTLAKKYDNKSLYTDKNVTLKDTISTSKILNQTINAGAVDYYEVSGDNTIEVISGNNNYVGLKIYGYKDGIYTELASSMEEFEVDLTYYVRYDKFYIAVYNADITNSNTYTLKVKDSDFSENSEFITTFNNYNIEIEMDISVAGITTNTVSKGVIDEQHQKEYLDITTTSMGIVSLNNKMYYDFNTGYSYMTQPYGGDVWWKEKSASQVVDLGIILDKLISMKNVTKIADNHYKVNMTKEDIEGLMASGNANASEISGDIYVEVYTENGYITRLEYDFSNMIKGFEKFTTTIKYSNYDTAGNVEIPQSIIDNAIEQ